MINVNEVKEVLGVYTSQLYKDFYAVDVLVERGNIIFKIRCPYNAKNKAEQAVLAMAAKKQENIPEPDYKPLIWIVGSVNQKGR